MTCQGYNIKIVEGNAFALVLPLKRRTFVSERPIDEDIEILSLENVVVKISDVVYANTLEEDGVHVVMPATLSRGTYQIELTAIYQGSAIRAAYFEAFTIVAWNYQSDAQQYIAGSPIVLNAAYVIGGTLTDAELEALKEEYREKNAQLDQAIADAEEAKREWEQKAAGLDGVAQEATSQEILTAVENIDIDTSDLAKEVTLEAVSGKIGTPAQGQPTDLFAAIAQGGGGGVGGGVPVVQMTATTATIEPNKLYIWDEVTSLDLTLATPTDPNIVNEYMVMFGAGSVLPTLTLPAVVEVRGEMDYNKIMCLSIINNIAYLA